MLKLWEPILADLAVETIDLAPRRFGLVAACDGGLLEVTGLSVPVGAMCRVAYRQETTLLAEVIGFRNGRTMMMLLGDTVSLRPGARVCPEGRPGMLPVGEAFLGRAVDGEGLPIDGGLPIAWRQERPAGGVRTSALDRSPVRETFRHRRARAQCADHFRHRPAHRRHGRIGRRQIRADRHDRARFEPLTSSSSA